MFKTVCIVENLNERELVEWRIRRLEEVEVKKEMIEEEEEEE